MNKKALILNNIRSSIKVKEELLKDTELVNNIEKTVIMMVDTYIAGGKVLFCGNGGSAADAQHLAAELSGRYSYDRPPLYAEALHVNSSYITAVANDYSFDIVYGRLVEAMAQEGDIVVGLSTSGNSDNVINALKQAKQQKCTTVGMTGESGGRMKNYSDILLNVKSSKTPRIQECHMVIGHSICELVEQMIFPRN